MPRLTIRNEAIEQTVLERLSKGEPLAVIGRDEGMPHPTTWRSWCDADENLAIAYARARDDGFDAIAVEALAILDEEPERVVTTSGDDRAETRIDSAAVARAKNRFEGRMKLLSKWDPKRYGEMIKHAAPDGETPLVSSVTVAFVKTDAAAEG